jgi:glycerophosphoryl diester phosphodiesterase
MPGDQVENRLEAFQAALEAGADGVEFDVQLSADGVPMVIHDTRLERTTGRPGRVGDFGSVELEGLGVPRLERVLDGLGDEAVLNIEIKDFTPRNRDLEHAVVDLVKAKRAEGRVLFSSFNPLALARLVRVDPAFYAAQLTAPGWLRVLRLGYLRLPVAVHPHFSEVKPWRLASWRARGRRVIAWGADTEEELTAALRLDLDGIITDRPAEAVRLLRASPPPGSQ